MSLITLDWETYYAQDFGFRTMTTEEYIRDKRFQEIGVGIKVDDEPARWFSGTHQEIKKHLTELTDWSDAALLCHNTLFDGDLYDLQMNNWDTCVAVRYQARLLSGHTEHGSCAPRC